jgi:hypothetical protein
MALFRRTRQQVPTAGSAPQVTPIGEITARQRVRVMGQVTRMRQRPATGLPALVVTVSDGSSSITALWSGRRSIGGIGLGRQLIIEGMAVDGPDGITFFNPAYELLH